MESYKLFGRHKSREKSITFDEIVFSYQRTCPPPFPHSHQRGRRTDDVVPGSSKSPPHRNSTYPGAGRNSTLVSLTAHGGTSQMKHNKLPVIASVGTMPSRRLRQRPGIAPTLGCVTCNRGLWTWASRRITSVLLPDPTASGLDPRACDPEDNPRVTLGQSEPPRLCVGEEPNQNVFGSKEI